MAILIKKGQKVVTPVQLIASDTEKAVVDHSVLEDVGFLEDGPVAKVGVYKEGQRVRVTLLPYPWTIIWKLGDTGTVRKVWEAAREFRVLGDGNGVVAVVMDVVRKEGWEVIYFAEKHLELVL